MGRVLSGRNTLVICQRHIFLHHSLGQNNIGLIIKLFNLNNAEKFHPLYDSKPQYKNTDLLTKLLHHLYPAIMVTHGISNYNFNNQTH